MYYKSYIFPTDPELDSVKFCVTFEKSKLKSPFPSKELGVGT